MKPSIFTYRVPEMKKPGNVTVETLQRAAALVGRELRLDLV